MSEHHHHHLIGQRHEYVFDKSECPACQAEGQRVTHIFVGKVDEGLAEDMELMVTVFANGTANISYLDHEMPSYSWSPPTELEAREVE